MRQKAVFLGEIGKHKIDKVYSSKICNELSKYLDIYHCIINREHFEEHKQYFKEAEFAFSTWGIPSFSENEIKTYMPNLKVVFYAAGSVQHFAKEFLQCGVKVCSAWMANAIPVAEFAAAQIILANKGAYQSSKKLRGNYSDAKEYCRSFPGNYSVKVGILGAGAIGSLVIKLLKPYNLKIMVFDPFLSDQRAKELGVTKHSLEEVFSSCQTISSHLANKAEIAGILNKQYFKLMLPNATFINTGRGAQVIEEDLIEALKEFPDRTALLDVTWPEPPKKDSELLKMDNILLTPHIAGSQGNEVERMAEYMLDEYIRFRNGSELKYEVTLDMLNTMA